MIHQVNSSPSDVERLLHIVELQIQVLTVAAKVSSLSPPYDEIYNGLSTTYPDDEQREEVKEWVTRKPTLTKALNDFASHNNIEKQQFVKDIRHDVNLLMNPRKKSFKVIIDKSVSWQMAASNFLGYFYTYFGRDAGFEVYLFPSTINKATYNRWDFIDGFTSSNPNLRLCAVCDSTLYRTTISGRAYTSIDHFFPKALYPHLAVHPLNLIPICSHCNSGSAGATDPLSGNIDQGVLSFILPYQEIKGLGCQTYISIETEIDTEKHPIKITILPDKDHPNVGILIENFENIYGVQDRWNAKQEIEWIDQHVFRRITQFLTIYIEAANEFNDQEFIIDKLKILMAIISMEDLGLDPFGFVTVWLIKDHIDAIEKEGANAPLYKAIKNWASANEQSKRWADYRKRAEAIITRVPDTE